MRTHNVHLGVNHFFKRGSLHLPIYARVNLDTIVVNLISHVDEDELALL